MRIFLEHANRLPLIDATGVSRLLPFGGWQFRVPQMRMAHVRRRVLW
jgi:hypothetical protein